MAQRSLCGEGRASHSVVAVARAKGHPAGALHCGGVWGQHAESGGGQVAGGSFTPLSMESGRLGRPAMQLLQTLAAAAASFARAGSDVTTSSFVTGALRELGVALVKGNEVVYREALHVYATAGSTAARVGATVPTVDPE
jgi:hypothetical protein